MTLLKNTAVSHGQSISVCCEFAALRFQMNSSRRLARAVFLVWDLLDGYNRKATGYNNPSVQYLIIQQPRLRGESITLIAFVGGLRLHFYHTAIKKADAHLMLLPAVLSSPVTFTAAAFYLCTCRLSVLSDRLRGFQLLAYLPRRRPFQLQSSQYCK